MREIDWEDFKSYLSKTCRKNTAKARICYAKQYASVLLTTEPTATSSLTNALVRLSPDTRINVMKSLVALSKYLGCYDRWLHIKQRYSLKWTSGNESMQPFENMFNQNDESQDYNAIIQAIRQIIQKLPLDMAQIIIFACLVGLRAAEVIESVKLLVSEVTKSKYYNLERQCLEHFRFPEIFLRKTKKAYISFVSYDMIAELISGSYSVSVPSYDAIRHKLAKQGVKCDMQYCRKVFATHLRQSGIATEIIDSLQGRTPSSVFAKHYYRPSSMEYRDKVLDAIKALKQKILQ